MASLSSVGGQQQTNSNIGTDAKRSSTLGSSTLGNRRSTSRLSASAPVPTKRENAGNARIFARDQWNARELNIQEILNKHDHDWAVLETQEFRELQGKYVDSCGQTHDWNVADMQFQRSASEARNPAPVSLSHWTLGIADLNGDGKVQMGELHYAMRAWDAFKNPDSTVLRQFATFDTEPAEPTGVDRVQALLTELNEGRLVDLSEVRSVIELAESASIADAACDGASPLSACRAGRAELLAAIAIWFTHVERQDTDLHGLMSQAMMHSMQEVTSPDVFGEGGRMLETVTTKVMGRYVGYAQVGDSSDANAPATTPDRIRAALPGFCGKLGKYAYGFFPPLFSFFLICIGWASRGSDCPRNLDGILIWFGGANLLHWTLMHTGQPPPPRNTATVHRPAALSDVVRLHSKEWLYWRWMPARVAVAVVLVSLAVVGFMWTMGGRVQNNEELCGVFLVHFSEFIWIAIPGVLVALLVLYIALKLKKLKHHDALLQRSSSLTTMR